MTLVSYMGTKVALAKEIVQAFDSLPRGPLLDVFAGMSAVGRATAHARNIWSNDAQHFSKVMSEFQFLSGDIEGIRATSLLQALRASLKHEASLSKEHHQDLIKESFALATNNWVSLAALEESFGRNLEKSIENHCTFDSLVSTQYRLFTDLYAGTYFSLRQCIEIDSLCKGIFQVTFVQDKFNIDVRNWMISALGATMSRCSNSTGHFAQYITPSEKNFSRVLSKRKRSIRREWLKRLRAAKPVGTSEWRSHNRVFCQDACDLLRRLSDQRVSPAVIYADPPYTADQYSRYYHILDTLVLYDYPHLSGKGRYRPKRFVSEWSLKSKVDSCFRTLIERSHGLGAALVISYPEGGLLDDSSSKIPDMMRNSYPVVRCLTPVVHHHSTMGASKGPQRHQVAEQVFIASFA